jgi:hypothetical protein
VSKSRFEDPPNSRRLDGALHSLAVLAGTLVLGCSSVSIQRLEPRTGSVQLADSVVVLSELPSVPYRSIARIEVRDRGRGRSAAQLREKLIATARELGADAVVVDPPSTRRGWFIGPGLVSHYDDLMVTGLAIVLQPAQSRLGGADGSTPDLSLERTSPGALRSLRSASSPGRR